PSAGPDWTGLEASTECSCRLRAQWHAQSIPTVPVVRRGLWTAERSRHAPTSRTLTYPTARRPRAKFAQCKVCSEHGLHVGLDFVHFPPLPIHHNRSYFQRVPLSCPVRASARFASC